MPTAQFVAIRLTGHLAGFTGVLAGHEFDNGLMICALAYPGVITKFSLYYGAEIIPQVVGTIAHTAPPIADGDEADELPEVPAKPANTVVTPPTDADLEEVENDPTALPVWSKEGVPLQTPKRGAKGKAGKAKPKAKAGR
jgi:hypothetical protein